MPSFEYQKKIKQEFLEGKKKKKNCRALLFKMLKLRVLDLFFHWNKCFCYYTESKVPKKGTGTEFQVPIPVQMWTVPNPTCKWVTDLFSPLFVHDSLNCITLFLGLCDLKVFSAKFRTQSMVKMRSALKLFLHTACVVTVVCNLLIWAPK